MPMKWKFVVVCAAVMVGGCGKNDVVKPPVPDAPVATPAGDWTHKELLEHLEKSGISFQVDRRFAGDLPRVDVRIKDAPLAYADYSRMATNEAAYDARITLLKSDREAKERAGAMGENGFAFGRFLFEGYKRDNLAVVRKAMDGALTDADMAGLRRKWEAQAAADEKERQESLKELERFGKEFDR